MPPINDFRGEYRWLSNFHLVKVELDGQSYSSTENAYQAAKTLDLDMRRVFRVCTPSEGQNWLGRLLMQVRSELQSAQQ